MLRAASWGNTRGASRVPGLPVQTGALAGKTQNHVQEHEAKRTTMKMGGEKTFLLQGKEPGDEKKS